VVEHKASQRMTEARLPAAVGEHRPV